MDNIKDNKIRKYIRILLGIDDICELERLRGTASDEEIDKLYELVNLNANLFEFDENFNKIFIESVELAIKITKKKYGEDYTVEDFNKTLMFILLETDPENKISRMNKPSLN